MTAELKRPAIVRRRQFTSFEGTANAFADEASDTFAAKLASNASRVAFAFNRDSSKLDGVETNRRVHDDAQCAVKMRARQ